MIFITHLETEYKYFFSEECWTVTEFKILKTALQGIKTGTRASETKGKFHWKVEKNGGEMWCSHTWSRFEKTESYRAYWYCKVKWIW